MQNTRPQTPMGPVVKQHPVEGHVAIIDHHARRGEKIEFSPAPEAPCLVGGLHPIAEDGPTAYDLLHVVVNTLTSIAKGAA